MVCDGGDPEDEVDTALAIAQGSVPALDGRARDRHRPTAGKTICTNPPGEVRDHLRGPIYRGVASESSRNRAGAAAHDRCVGMRGGHAQDGAESQPALQRLDTQGSILSPTDLVHDLWLRMGREQRGREIDRGSFLAKRSIKTSASPSSSRT